MDTRSPLGALTVAAAAAAAAPDAAWGRSGASSRRATPHGGATPALRTARSAPPLVQVRAACLLPGLSGTSRHLLGSLLAGMKSPPC